MGTDLETVQEEQKKKYKAAIFEMGHHVVHRLVRAWLHSPFLFSLSPLGQRQGKALCVLHNFSLDVIRKRRETRKIFGVKTVTEEVSEDDMKGSKKRMAMLDLLLTAEEEGSIDENGIREEVDTFMFEVSIESIIFVLKTFPIEN